MSEWFKQAGFFPLQRVLRSGSHGSIDINPDDYVNVQRIPAATAAAIQIRLAPFIFVVVELGDARIAVAVWRVQCRN